MKRYLIAAIVLLLAGEGRSADVPPNVLMIVVDDMNDWVGCLGGHPNTRTPNIDRLAARGLLFTNAHCTASVCNASRTSVLTGRRPSSTGIYANDVIWHQAFPEVQSIPQYFKAHGYHVAGGGKVHHHSRGFNRPGDWHEYFEQVFDGDYHRRLMAGEDISQYSWPAGFPLNQIESVRLLKKPPQNPYEFDWGPLKKADKEMGDGQLVDWASRYLANPPREPFFLATGIFRPHLPFYAPQKYFDALPIESVSVPPMIADDNADLPPAGQRMAASRRGDYELVQKTGKHAELIQAYLANIAFADALIGRLLDALDSGAARDNTIVVLWSDHGWHFGEKGQLHKFTLWERSTRVPFIVAAPGVTKPGTVSARPASLLDVFPTLLDLCRLPPCDGLEGISLVPLLHDPTRPWGHPAVTTQGRGNHSVRDDRWRYIRYADGGEELYDHASDPNEWTNLASQEEWTQVKKRLASHLPLKNAVAPKRDTSIRSE